MTLSQASNKEWRFTASDGTASTLFIIDPLPWHLGPTSFWFAVRYLLTGSVSGGQHFWQSNYPSRVYCKAAAGDTYVGNLPPQVPPSVALPMLRLTLREPTVQSGLPSPHRLCSPDFRCRAAWPRPPTAWAFTLVAWGQDGFSFTTEVRSYIVVFLTRDRDIQLQRPSLPGFGNWELSWRWLS